MSFLIWNNQQDTEDSMDMVNSYYIIVPSIPGDYRMDMWDILSKSNVSNEWGFFAAEDRPGLPYADLMREQLVGDFEEVNERPDDWIAELI